METGERAELLFVAAELCGANEFVFNAPNVRAIELLQARALYLRSLMGQLLEELCQHFNNAISKPAQSTEQIPKASLRFLDFEGGRAYACFSMEPCSKDRSRQDAGAPGIEPCFKD